MQEQKLHIALLVKDPDLRATWEERLRACGVEVYTTLAEAELSDLLICEPATCTIRPADLPWLILLPPEIDAGPWLARGAWDVLRTSLHPGDLQPRLALFRSLLQGIARNDQTIAAVQSALQDLLMAADWRQVLPTILARLGSVTGARRLYLYQRTVTENNKPVLEKRGEWVAPELEGARILPQRVHLPGVGLQRWEVMFQAGKIISGPVESLPPQEQCLLRRYAIQNLTVIPIHIAEAWWGVVGLDVASTDRPEDYIASRTLRRRIEVLVAVLHARLLQDNLMQNADAMNLLQVFVRVVQNWTQTQDSADLGALTLREVCRVVQAQRGVIWLSDAQNRTMNLMAIHGFPPELGLYPGSVTLRQGEGLAGWVYTRRQSACVADVTTDSRWADKGRIDEGVRSALCVPLITQKEVIGVMTLTHPQVGHFEPTHVSLAETMATLVAAVIANARLYQESQARTREAQLLRQTAEHLSQSLDMQDVVANIFTALQQALPFDDAVLQGYDPLTNTIQFIGGRGIHINRLTPPVGPLPLDERSPHAMAIHRAQPVLIADTTALYGARAQAHRHTPFTSGRSVLSVPLISRNAVAAVLTLSKAEPDFYTQEHLRLASAIAAEAVIALENSRLFTAEQEQRRLAEALIRAAHLVNSSLDLNQVITRILEQVERVVPGDSFNVMLIEGEELIIAEQRQLRSNAKPAPVGRFPLSGFPLLQDVMTSGVPLIINDTTQEARWVSLESAREVRAYLCAPIRYGSKTLGFLNANSRQAYAFTPAMAKQLQAFADQVASALENARLYARLRSYAEELEARVAERTQHLQAQSARLSAILNSLNEGLVVMGTDGMLQDVNPVAQAWLSSLNEESRQRLEAALKDLAQRGAEKPSSTLELSGLDLQLRAAPVITDEAAPSTCVITLTDVTPLRNLERMKTRLITNISHELRTPVTTIRLYLRLLERAKPDQRAEYLQAISAEIENLNIMLENILQMARIEAGKVISRVQPVDLTLLLEQLMATFKSRLEQKQLTLTSVLPPTPLIVTGDQSQLLYLCQNLLTNAITYTPEGGRITVELEALNEPHPRARLRICDTGIGIPAHELPHIFERFYRGEQPEKQQISGSGIGLSIVKEVVNQHHGEIEVASEVGKGTCFTVYLPM